MIRVTKLTDYGIVLLTSMACREPGQITTARGLSESTYLAFPMVSKILKSLARAGVLESQRGAGGGYSLVRAPEEITIAEIIAALQGPIAITECADEETSNCVIDLLCPIRSNWQVINRAVKSALEGITLAQMTRPLIGARVAPSAPRPAATTAEPVG